MTPSIEFVKYMICEEEIFKVTIIIKCIHLYTTKNSNL